MFLLSIVRCVQLCVLEYVRRISRGIPSHPPPQSSLYIGEHLIYGTCMADYDVTDIYLGGAKSPSLDKRLDVRKSCETVRASVPKILTLCVAVEGRHFENFRHSTSASIVSVKFN